MPAIGPIASTAAMGRTIISRRPPAASDLPIIRIASSARAFLAQSETPRRAYAPSAGRRRQIAEMAQQHPPARQMHGGQKRGEQDQRGEITARIPAADRCAGAAGLRRARGPAA
jgi:hypothetical protein